MIKIIKCIVKKYIGNDNNYMIMLVTLFEQKFETINVSIQTKVLSYYFY